MRKYVWEKFLSYKYYLNIVTRYFFSASKTKNEFI